MARAGVALLAASIAFSAIGCRNESHRLADRRALDVPSPPSDRELRATPPAGGGGQAGMTTPGTMQPGGPVAAPTTPAAPPAGAGAPAGGSAAPQPKR